MRVAGPQLHAADSCFLGGPTGPVGRIQPSRAPSIMAPFSSFPYLQQHGWRDHLFLFLSTESSYVTSTLSSLLLYASDDVNSVT